MLRNVRGVASKPQVQEHPMACSLLVRTKLAQPVRALMQWAPLFPEPGPISESDIFTWEALIMGPKDTPFEGGVFAAKLTFVRALYPLRDRMQALIRSLTPV